MGDAAREETLVLIKAWMDEGMSLEQKRKTLLSASRSPIEDKVAPALNKQLDLQYLNEVREEEILKATRSFTAEEITERILIALEKEKWCEIIRGELDPPPAREEGVERP